MNLSKETEEFIQGHPSVKDCLKKDLVNFSALARTIQGELGIKKESGFDAILVAVRRAQEKLAPGRGAEEKILSVVRKGKMQIKNRVCVLVFSPKTPLSSLTKSAKEILESNEGFHMVQGTNAITLIVGEEFGEVIAKEFKDFLLKKKTGLVEITIKSPQKIEETPGVVSYMYSLFAENGINIAETLSCWTDTLFLIEEKDLQKAIEVLKF